MPYLNASTSDLRSDLRALKALVDAASADANVLLYATVVMQNLFQKVAVREDRRSLERKTQKNDRLKPFPEIMKKSSLGVALANPRKGKVSVLEQEDPVKWSLSFMTYIRNSVVHLECDHLISGVLPVCIKAWAVFEDFAGELLSDMGDECLEDDEDAVNDEVRKLMDGIRLGLSRLEEQSTTPRS